MGETLIRPDLLEAHWRLGEVWDHSATLAPFLAVHAGHSVRRATGHAWAWTRRDAVEDGLAAAWSMAGRWGARRAVTVSRRRFDLRVAGVVPRLAKRLNALRILCLRDLAALDAGRYRRAVLAIHQTVLAISKLRTTTQTEPVLGSKVLHHYFPSVVPVFDAKYIRKGVMRRPAFRRFLEEDADGWIVLADAREAGGARMLDFHRYLAFCAAQIGEVRASRLRAVRQRFAVGFRDLAPLTMLRDRRSLLWTMDAKIAEYCFVGEAFG